MRSSTKDKTHSTVSKEQSGAAFPTNEETKMSQRLEAINSLDLEKIPQQINVDSGRSEPRSVIERKLTK